MDGICLYATPWNTRDGYRFFRENFYGLYSHLFGMKLSEDIRKFILPQMKSMLSEDDYQGYKEALENNKTGLQTLDEKVYSKMYGYKDVW